MCSSDLPPKLLLRRYSMRYSATTAPLSRGAVHDRTIVVREKRSVAAAGLVGALGTRYGSNGVTASERCDVPDEPPPFAASAVKVYALPFVRPDTVHELLFDPVTATVHERPPGEAVNVMVVPSDPL